MTPKKVIGMALPLMAINEAASQERSIRHPVSLKDLTGDGQSE